MNQITHFLIHVLMQYVPFVFYMVVLVQLIGLPAPAIPFLIAAGILVGAGHMILGTAVGLGVLVVLFGDRFRYTLSCRPDRREFHSESGTIVPPPGRFVGLRMSHYLLHSRVGTSLLVGSGVGLGYAFSGRLDTAVSMVVHPGPVTALVVLGIAAGYFIYNALHRAGGWRLVSKLTIPHITKEMPEGKKPAVIELRPQATPQEVSSTPGSLAFSGVLRSDTRLRRRQKMR
jgi:membrane protein DedA with SNARE-associated domain